MVSLVVVLWALYLSECFVRWRPGDWIYRPTLSGDLRGRAAPDVSFLDGRFCLVWTSLVPGSLVYRFSGSDVDRRTSQLRLHRVRQRSRLLRVSSTALFLVIMLVVPALIWTERIVPLLPALAVTLGLVWAVTLWSYLSTHKKAYGSAPAMESWLVLALSPISLMRAPVLISLEASPATHPAIAANLLCDTSEFLRVARLWHFDVPELRADLERLAARRGHPNALTSAPVEYEAGVSLFCRRCHATYATGAAGCVDCEGVGLTPLPAPTFPAQRAGGVVM